MTELRRNDDDSPDRWQIPIDFGSGEEGIITNLYDLHGEEVTDDPRRAVQAVGYYVTGPWTHKWFNVGVGPDDFSHHGVN